MNKNFMTLIMGVSFMSIHSTDEYTFKTFKRTDIEQFTTFITKKRSEFYKSYPYLFQSDADQERANEYASWFAQLPDSALVIAYHNQIPIAFCWGASLTDFDEHVPSIELFKKENLDPKTFYYISDIIFDSGYNNENYIPELLKKIADCAYDFGYTRLCIAEKEDELSHPLRPNNYQSNTKILTDNGFEKTSFFATFHWQTLQHEGIIKDQEHQLYYWIR